MAILDRYIARAVLGGFVVVAAVLTLLFSLWGFVEELDAVGGSYTTLDAFVHVALMLPQTAVSLLPTSVLLGFMLSLGSLARQNEIVAIRSAGLSTLRFAWFVVKTALAVGLLTLASMEFALPPLAQMAETTRSVATTATPSLRSKYGFWSRDDRRFINVGSVEPGQIPADIDIYEFSAGGELTRFTQARRASRTADGTWTLHQVRQKTLTATQSRISRHPRQDWHAFLTPSQMEILFLEPDSLSLSALYRYIESLEERGLRSDQYELALWRKLASAASVLAMALLAVPTAFGPMRKAGAGYRFVAGATIGILFYLASEIIAYAGLLYELNAAVAALAPPGAVGVIALGILWRER